MTVVLVLVVLVLVPLVIIALSSNSSLANRLTILERRLLRLENEFAQELDLKTPASPPAAQLTRKEAVAASSSALLREPAQPAAVAKIVPLAVPQKGRCRHYPRGWRPSSPWPSPSSI